MRVVGVGIDLVEVSRVERLLVEAPRFRTRVFAPSEIELCEARRRPAPCYAARWAVREAVTKALGGIPGGRWLDVTVVRAPEGPVSVETTGATAERARELGVERLLISISHERGHAAAVCVAVGGE